MVNLFRPFCISVIFLQLSIIQIYIDLKFDVDEQRVDSQSLAYTANNPAA